MMSTQSNHQTNGITDHKPQIFEEINFQEEFCQMPNINPDNQFKLIRHIDINTKNLILATKTGLYLFDLKQPKLAPKLIIEGDISHATFIPNTYYLAYSTNMSGQNQFLYIFNINQQKPAAKIKLDAQIQQIKPSKTCLGVASLQEIFIIHFPTLKPIYNGPAGNYVNLIFDLSQQGLTLAHNSFNQGQLIIRNFTNIKRNHALTERKKSIYSSRLKPSNLKPSEGLNFSSALPEEQQIEVIIKVKAHKDCKYLKLIEVISQIKVSPNGSKVVTSSLKGTVLRVFSTKNGEKLEQFRVGYEISKIVDISFVYDGNILGCMNETGMIMLYNVSMDKQQMKYQTQRKGHKIYTQTNPKSFFSFLSFLYPPFNDSFCFNHFKLINPQFKEQSDKNIDPNINKSFSKSESAFDDQRLQNKQNQKFNHSIKELDQEHNEDILNPSPERSDSIQSNSSFLLKDNTQTFKKTDKKSYPQSKGLPSQKSLHDSLKGESSREKNNRNNSPSRTTPLINSSRLTSREKKSRISLKIKSIGKKRGSNIGSLKKQEDVKKKLRKNYNLVSRLIITEGNYIWAVKGFHLFGLKYDSFHGGEMVLDQSMKIL